MEMIDWLQLLAPFVAVGLGILAYGHQKDLDRKEQVLSECREVYREFLSRSESLLMEMCGTSEESETTDELEKHSDSVLRDYREALLTLKVYGSDGVVDAAKPLLMDIVRVSELGEDDADFFVARENVRGRIDGIVLKMRDDCLESSWRGKK